jgi:hypothetical protein
MKSKIKDQYFAIDVVNLILCILIIVSSVIAFIDINNNVWMLPYIIFIGAIVNMMAGFKSLKQNKKGILLLLGGTILLAIALIRLFS